MLSSSKLAANPSFMPFLFTDVRVATSLCIFPCIHHILDITLSTTVHCTPIGMFCATIHFPAVIPRYLHFRKLYLRKVKFLECKHHRPLHCMHILIGTKQTSVGLHIAGPIHKHFLNGRTSAKKSALLGRMKFVLSSSTPAQETLILSCIIYRDKSMKISKSFKENYIYWWKATAINGFNSLQLVCSQDSWSPVLIWLLYFGIKK